MATNANILEAGLQALKQTLASSLERDVTYTHAGQQYQIRATRGAINWATLNKLGDVALGENYRDYNIRAELLPVEPSRGDTIQDGSEVYELYSESTAQKCYRYSDPYKQLIRVYTRRLEANVTE